MTPIAGLIASRSISVVGLIREAGHGTFLKVGALATRVVFLFLIAPRLLDGELAMYLLYGTIAALAARVLTFGLEEQLPLFVAGVRQRAQAFLSLAKLVLGIEALLIALVIVSGSIFGSILLLTICYANTSLLAGTLRTVRVSGAERLRDLHWPMFVTVAMLPEVDTAAELLLVMAIALFCVQMLEWLLSRKIEAGPRSEEDKIWRRVAELTKRSWTKLLASFSMLAIARALILWPSLLGSGAELDSLAYAIMLGEAFWQLAMVLVFRRYALYCSLLPSERTQIGTDVRKVAMVLVAFTLCAAGATIAAGRLGVEIAKFDRWSDASALVVYFGALAIFLLSRFAVWVFVDFDWRISLFEVAAFLGIGLVVMLAPASAWPLAATTVLAILALVTLVYLERRVVSGSITMQSSLAVTQRQGK